MIRPTFSLPLCLLLVACGGSEPSPRTAHAVDDEPEQRGTAPLPAVVGEVGALDEDKVTEVFTESISQLKRCLDDGAQRVEFIGGSVSFYVKVDQGGQLQHAHLEQSSLGDRATEKCMLNALRGKSWPRPVGGETGFARKSFDFDPPNDVRPPTEWDEGRVEDTLSKQSEDISRCKSAAPGTYKVTMYVGTSGKALSVGVTPPDERGEEAIDCLVEVLSAGVYPSPGSWPAKVSFSL